jgi:hypothetical protein
VLDYYEFSIIAFIIYVVLACSRPLLLAKNVTESVGLLLRSISALTCNIVQKRRVRDNILPRFTFTCSIFQNVGVPEIV